MSLRAPMGRGNLVEDTMTYLFMAFFAALILAADQFTKLLTVANIPLFGRVDFLPGIVSLTYVQNDGAAFSMLEGQQWLFAVVFAEVAA